MNNRQKGLQRVREVRKMLEGMGHKVEGPGYGVAFFGGSMRPIHRDFFGIADLMSSHDGVFHLHQVTDLKNKSKHVKAIQDGGLSAWLWCKIEGKFGYRIFIVTPDSISEAQAIFKGEEANNVIRDSGLQVERQ